MSHRLNPFFITASRVLVVTACTLMVTTRVEAQCGDPNVPQCFEPAPPNAVNAPTPGLSVSSPASCTLADEGYLKVGSQVRVDVAASVVGGCKVYYWGQYWYTALQGMNYVYWSQVLPVQQNMPNFANSQPQTIDTTQPAPASGSGYQLRTFNTVGQNRYTFYTEAQTSSCNLPRLSSNVVRNVNVVACKPEFWDERAQSPGGRLPATTIDVYLPPSMSSAYTALSNAVSDWNNSLSGSVPQLNVVTTPCDPSTNQCVTIRLGNIGGLCGYTDGHRTNGVFTDSVTIDLNTSIWNAQPGQGGFTASGLQRTLSHELGHTLGLDDSNTCGSSSDADMDPNFYCDMNVSLTQPTFGDVKAVNSSLYGGKTRVRCGF